MLMSVFFFLVTCLCENESMGYIKTRNMRIPPKHCSQWEHWNEDTWNGFLARFLITCSHSGIIRRVVCAIPCILLFGAEWA